MTQTYPQHLMVLGYGLTPSETTPGSFDLSPASQERVDTTVAYSREHALGGSALILCVGGSSPLYDGLGDNPDEESEAFKMEEKLSELGIVAVAAGVRSKTTMSNFTEAIKEGALQPSNYSRKFPIGVVAHKNHYMRARIDAWRTGFNWRAIRGIHPEDYLENSQSQKDFLRNIVGIGISAVVYAGVRRGDTTELSRRDDKTIRILSRTHAFLSRVLGKNSEAQT